MTPTEPLLRAPSLIERPWASVSGLRWGGSLAGILMGELGIDCRVIRSTHRPALPRTGARAAAGDDRIKAWSDDPCRFCVQTGAHHGVATAPPRAGVRRIFPATITALSETDERAWRAAGAQGLTRLDALELAASTPPPPSASHQIPRQEGDALVIALADHPQHIDVRLLIYVASLIAVDGRPTILAVPSTAREIPAGRRYRRGFDLPLRLVELTGNIAPYAAVADAAIVCPAPDEPDRPCGAWGGTTLIAALCAAWGVPVVRLPRTDPMRRDARRLVGPLFEALEAGAQGRAR